MLYSNLLQRLSLNHLAIVSTLLVLVIQILFPNILATPGTSYFIVALLLTGIIHGASDYFIYSALSTEIQSRTKNYRFNLLYLGTILLYITIWSYWPGFALLIFLGISIYHFGQSNWHQYQLSNNYLSFAVYLLWGAFVVFIPLILHIEEANKNLAEIMTFNVKFNPIVLKIISHCLIWSNVLVLVLLVILDRLSIKSALKEAFNLMLLFALFYYTPLLLGFAIYFVFWHSTYATQEQIQILQERIHAFSIKSYLKSLCFISIFTFLILGLIYFLCFEVMGIYFGWGLFFLFLSLLTLPHALIIDQVYERG